MKKKYTILLSLATFGLLFVSSCYYDNTEELYPLPAICDTVNITYTNTLKSIVDAQCATPDCHQSAYPSGYDFTTYEGLQKVAKNGSLLAAITHTGDFPMPKDANKLDDCTIAKFRAWVNNGQPK